MVEVRPAREDDGAALRSVAARAFGDEGPLIARLLDALDAAGHTRVDLVAVDRGTVVGHVRLSRSWVDARERQVEVLVLSPLGVDPAHQQRGIGSALLEAAVAAAGELGAPAVFLEGDPGFYSARGWQPGSRHGFTRPSVRIPEPAFQVVLLPGHQDWMRGALVYGDPFWALDVVGLRDPLLRRLEQVFESGL
ncbi:GNAT family N-acetyltransferase [Nocardioides sp. SYSU D00038]|uniref:GNAT family N-acetyltransferase n=1 Tax=Nocardioides sp. SYSU D00038 TaxID=2812554 RepID=UPI0019683F7C|nr:GNAT family N-acetyltransferase [Nocardioides sp. SYSU D00038]